MCRSWYLSVHAKGTRLVPRLCQITCKRWFNWCRSSLLAQRSTEDAKAARPDSTQHRLAGERLAGDRLTSESEGASSSSGRERSAGFNPPSRTRLSKDRPDLCDDEAASRISDPFSPGGPTPGGPLLGKLLVLPLSTLHSQVSFPYTLPKATKWGKARHRAPNQPSPMSLTPLLSQQQFKRLLASGLKTAERSDCEARPKALHCLLCDYRS